MKLFDRHIVTLLFAAALISCEREPLPQTRISIAFGTTSEEQLASKSMGDDVASSTTETMKSAAFGVYGVHADNPGLKKSDGTNVFTSSEAVNVGHNGTSWEYSPLAYWTFNDYYRFRAYHPINGKAFTVQNSSDVDLISIDYKVVNGSEDLMVAFWKRQATESVIKERVPMVFHHCLSGLIIKVGLTDDSSTDSITELYIKGLTPNGTMLYTYETPEDPSSTIDYDSATMKWVTETFDSSTEYYKWTGSKVIAGGVTSSNPGNATPVFGGDGTEHMVFTIPQTCSGTRGNTVIYFKTKQGGDAVQAVKIPQTEWLPGHIYTYTLLISPTSNIEVLISIKDWEAVEINEDIHIV